MRFYGVSDQDCMRMPYRRLIGLYQTIRAIQIEEEARSVVIAHQTKPKDFLHGLQRELHDLTHGRSGVSQKPVEINHVITRYEESRGEIFEERNRQKQAAARLAALRESYGGHIPPDVLLAELTARRG